MPSKKPVPKKRLGRQSCDLACGSLLIAAERLVTLVGNQNQGGFALGTWDTLPRSERARELAGVLQELAVGQAILAEALADQLS